MYAIAKGSARGAWHLYGAWDFLSDALVTFTFSGVICVRVTIATCGKTGGAYG